MLRPYKSLFLLAPAFALLCLAQTPSKTNAGQRTFSTTCAGCHGLDGRGGERGPNIAANAKLLRLSDPELSSIITNGVPGTGMPAFGSLGPATITSVTKYLRQLQGQKTPGAKKDELSGNPAQGKVVFFGKSDCSSCHMVHGEGGFLGPDLSAYGTSHSTTEIIAAITASSRTSVPGYKPGVAVTADGQRISGIVRNEDNFSLQIQTSDGEFHSFLKSDLKSFEYQTTPLMPANYAEKLTRDELANLAAYLVTVARDAPRIRTTPPEDPIEEQ